MGERPEARGKVTSPESEPENTPRWEEALRETPTERPGWM